jgi:hypothetical protein
VSYKAKKGGQLHEFIGEEELKWAFETFTFLE